jgi:hypothetical protein
MYITIPRKQKKVTTLKNLWDLRVDLTTNKITVSEETYDRLGMKDNNFILAVNPEDATDVALQISNVVTDDSFYITTPGSKRAKNKSFKDEVLTNYLRTIGGGTTNEFTLVHVEDNIYKIYNQVAIADNYSSLNLVQDIIKSEEEGTLIPTFSAPPPGSAIEVVFETSNPF